MHLKIPASSIFYSKCTTIKSKFSFTKSPHDLILLWRLFGSSVSLQSYTTSSPMPIHRGMGGTGGGGTGGVNSIFGQISPPISLY